MPQDEEASRQEPPRLAAGGGDKTAEKPSGDKNDDKKPPKSSDRSVRSGRKKKRGGTPDGQAPKTLMGQISGLWKKKGGKSNEHHSGKHKPHKHSKMKHHHRSKDTTSKDANKDNHKDKDKEHGSGKDKKEHKDGSDKEQKEREPLLEKKDGKNHATLPPGSKASDFDRPEAAGTGFVLDLSPCKASPSGTTTSKCGTTCETVVNKMELEDGANMATLPPGAKAEDFARPADAGTGFVLDLGPPKADGAKGSPATETAGKGGKVTAMELEGGANMASLPPGAKAEDFARPADAGTGFVLDLAPAPSKVPSADQMKSAVLTPPDKTQIGKPGPCSMAPKGPDNTATTVLAAAEKPPMKVPPGAHPLDLHPTPLAERVKEARPGVRMKYGCPINGNADFVLI